MSRRARRSAELPPGGRRAERVGAVIRPIAAVDLGAVAALERVLYPNPWRREHFAELLALPGGRGWVAATTSGEIVGYALTRLAADEAELANLAVAEPWRRRGIATRLLDTALGDARERGAARVWLEVRASNVAARSLYRRRGFTVVGQRPGYYLRPREDAIVMVADLVSVAPSEGPG